MADEIPIKYAPQCPTHLVKQIDNSCKPCGTPTIEGYPTEMVPDGPCMVVCPKGLLPFWHPRWGYWTCQPDCGPEYILDPEWGQCIPVAPKTEEKFPWAAAIVSVAALGGLGLYLRSRRSGSRR